MICNLIRSLEVISQRGLQLRKWSFNLRSGTHELAGGFTAAKHLVKFCKWISFRSSFHSCEMGFGLRNFRSSFRSYEIWHSLMRLSSNGHNFFVSNPIHKTFEVLDSWLRELRNDIYYASPGSTRNVSNSCCPLEFFMLDFSLCFPSCIHDLLLAKDYKAPKFGFFL